MKTLLRVTLIGIALLVSSETALAITVQGGVSCGTWVEDEAKHKNTTTGINSSRRWVVGYLSGLAVALQKDFWGKSGVNHLDPLSAFLWIDNYCRANPLKEIDDAAKELFFERVRKK